MAGSTACVPEVGGGHAYERGEPPFVPSRVEGQDEHAEGVVVADGASALYLPKGVVVTAAGADDEFADAATRVRPSRGRERTEPFIFVVVAGGDDVGAGGIQLVPERRRLDLADVNA